MFTYTLVNIFNWTGSILHCSNIFLFWDSIFEALLMWTANSLLKHVLLETAGLGLISTTGWEFFLVVSV